MLRVLLWCLPLLVIIPLITYLLQSTKKAHALRPTEYVRVKNWPDLPGDIHLGNPVGISKDSKGDIVVFHRAERRWPAFGAMPREPIHSNTILIIDKETGKLIRSWGADRFIMPHGLTIDQDDNIWVTDVALQQVFKFNADGKLLLALGEATVAGLDHAHFNMPTMVAVAADRSFYVSDGYGNSRIVKFNADGKYLFEWGTKGSASGEFNIPHGICLAANGNVYVADRENNRIQVFDSNGKWLKAISDPSFGAICSVAFDKTGKHLFAVDDLSFRGIKHRGSDVLVFNQADKVEQRFGRSGDYDGKTAWYHDLTIDGDENIYIGDILHNTLQKFKKN